MRHTDMDRMEVDGIWRTDGSLPGNLASRARQRALVDTERAKREGRIDEIERLKQIRWDGYAVRDVEIVRVGWKLWARKIFVPKGWVATLFTMKTFPHFAKIVVVLVSRNSP